MQHQQLHTEQLLQTYDDT